MVATPPVILVFDVSALSAASPTEWREFSRVGNCYIPQVVYEEMKMLFDRSPDPDLEQLAKAFNRFYTTSGWKVSDATAPHPALKVASGQALTRRARVSLAVGKCAYGLAQEFSNSLVVLVSKDRSLLQRLYDIPSYNLCGVTGDALLQWSRTGQRPIPVSQKFQQFRAAYGIQPDKSSGSSSASKSPPPPQPTSSVRTLPKATRAKPSVAPVFLSDWLPEVKSFILAVLGFAVAGYLLWMLVSGNIETLFRQQTNQQSFSGSVDTIGLSGYINKGQASDENASEARKS